jgi:hypothetical protein
MKLHYSLADFVVAAVIVLGMIPASAAAQTGSNQTPKKYAPPALSSEHSKPTPHTADGHPDLSGMWLEKYAPLGADTAAGKAPAAPRAQAAQASSYPSDALPYQPWALAKARQLHDAENTDPLLHCEPYGLPRIWGGAHPARFIQLPQELVILYERDTAFRIIPTDGRPHPKDVDPSWMGNSVGRWEGDTLVIDTIGLIEKSWLGTGKNAGEGSATFHSDALHVTERMRRPDSDHLTVEITNEDPKVFTKPWAYTWNMSLAPDEEMYEDVTCSNEKDFGHLVPDNPAAK